MSEYLNRLSAAFARLGIAFSDSDRDTYSRLTGLLLVDLTLHWEGRAAEAKVDDDPRLAVDIRVCFYPMLGGRRVIRKPELFFCE